MIQTRKGMLQIIAADEPTPGLTEWLNEHVDQVFWLRKSKHGALVFHALGQKPEACREPLNITSRSPMPLRLISNFAETPFVLDGRSYASIEGFWQGIKFPAEVDRQRLATLHGSAAKDAGYHAPKSAHVRYEGKDVCIGSRDHWQLMELACRTKFDQNTAARAALLSTDQRPLVHLMKPDSKTIPGIILSDIWTRIRSRLQGKRRAR